LSIRHGLLALLAHSPRYGYQLRQEFESSTGSTWPLNIGQVYTTLNRLERDGLIEATDEGDETHRVYALSEAGRAELAAWFESPVPRETPPRDELAIKLALAIRAQDVDVGQVIQIQRLSTIRALRQYTQAREAVRDDIAALLVADSLVFLTESELRWLDHCEATLANHIRDVPLPAKSLTIGDTPAAAKTAPSKKRARR